MLIATLFQRRKHPRYDVRFRGSLFGSAVGDTTGGLPCEVLDISRHGIRLAAAGPIPDRGDNKVRVELPMSSDVTVGVRILRSQEGESGGVEYAGELVFPSEKVRRGVNSLISSFDETAIRERRKGVRRHISVVHEPERRRGDRRQNFGILADCVAFSARASAWKATYTLFRRTESTRAARITVNGRELISFGSNDYYGLSHDPRVKEAGINALRQYGTTAGSRVLNGTLALHEQLEEELAEFKGAESTLLFTGGYLANVAILTALLQKGDVVFLDERAHASIIDGCVFSAAKLVPFRHNSVEDLRHKIQRVDHRRSVIIIDGVYSIEGNLARLPEILDLAAETKIPLMVDDAHGFGIMGERGSGTAEHFGVEGRIDLDIGMLGGALGGVGAFVACKRYIADYLRHFARGFLFTTTLPPASTAALLEALRIIKTDREIRAKLWANVEKLKAGLTRLGYKISATESAIISIFVGNEQDTYDIVRMLEERGVFVNAFIRPAVRRGEAKIRLTMTAAHSDLDIASTIEAFQDIKPALDARAHR